MNVFISGIAGFLGSNLADYYLKKNFKVSGCDSLVGGEIDNIDTKKINFTKGRCEDLNLMTRLLKGQDILIHAAAYAHEGLSTFSPTTIVSNNVVGSTSIFTAAIKNKVKRIVYCSSMARYGKIKIPFKETDIPEPVDTYGISKLASEKILINLCKTFGVEYNIAIPHNIIGPKQIYNDPFRNVVAIMSNLILQNRRPYIYGDGTQKRSFSDIDDCLFCLDQLITRKDIVNDIYNIGPDDNFISINELYQKLSNILKFNKEPIYTNGRPNEVKLSYCSSTKAKKNLNYKTQVNLDDSLIKIVDFIKKKGPKKFVYNYELEIINNKVPVTWKKKIF